MFSKLAQNSNSPGPIYKPDPKYLNTGKDYLPGAHIFSRPKDPKSSVAGPGPSAYNTTRAKSAAPAYTMGIKHRHLSDSNNDIAPNQVK